MVGLKDNDKMPFGKHKGKLMEDLPPSFKVWYLKNGPPGSVMEYFKSGEDDNVDNNAKFPRTPDESIYTYKKIDHIPSETALQFILSKLKVTKSNLDIVVTPEVIASLAEQWKKLKLIDKVPAGEYSDGDNVTGDDLPF